MRMRDISQGCWYLTSIGVGECLKVGGTHPPAVKLDIIHPLPRGVQWVKPRDIHEQVMQPRKGAPGDNEYRLTLPGKYPRNSPGHEDASVRQGYYVKAPTWQEAVKKFRAGAMGPNDQNDSIDWEQCRDHRGEAIGRFRGEVE